MSLFNKSKNRYHKKGSHMKKHTLLCFFLIFIFCVSSADSFAKPLHITLSPHKVNPGDVFVIKVTGAKAASPAFASMGGNEFLFSSCGKGCSMAIGAVDINTKPRAYTVSVKMGDRVKKIKLYVKRKSFPKIHLTLPEGKVSPGAEDLRRIRDENKRLAEIFQTASEKIWNGDFLLPVDHSISTVFGVKRIMNRKRTSIHRGMDIRGRKGDDIRASNDGKVVLAEELFFGGNTVILDHGQGIYTIYMHLSKFEVNVGDTVSKGDVIGLVGSTGRATGPHLHFGAKVAGVSVNPASLINLKL